MTMPPPDDPDIYQSLANALMTASAGIREANELGFAALEPIDRAIELTINNPALLQQSRALWQRAWDLREQANGLLPQDRDAGIEQADGRRRQADALMSRAVALSDQAHAAVLESRPLMRQGIETLMAASEIHRVALERAATLLTATRRPPGNGGAPDARAA